jgi:hypothetical protein
MFGYAVHNQRNDLYAVHTNEEVLEVREVLSAAELPREWVVSLAYEMQFLSETMWERRRFLPDTETLSRITERFMTEGPDAGDKEVVARMQELMEGRGAARSPAITYEVHAVANVGAVMHVVADRLRLARANQKALVHEAIVVELEMLTGSNPAGGGEGGQGELELDDETRQEVSAYVERLEQWDPTLIDDTAVDPTVVGAVALLNLFAAAEVIASAASLAVSVGGDPVSWYEPEDLLELVSGLVAKGGAEERDAVELGGVNTAAIAARLVATGLDPVQVMRLCCHPERETLAAEMLDVDEYSRFADTVNGDPMDPLGLAESCRRVEDLCVEWYREFHSRLEPSNWNLEPADIGLQTRLRLLELVGMGGPAAA